jgi:ABC-type glycerol-3-phosphate transport system substrate-binding protein
VQRIKSSIPFPRLGPSRFTGRLLAVIILIASLGLSACGGGGGEGDSSGGSEAAQTSAATEPIELTMWVAREQYLPTDAFMKSWNEKYPNIKLKAELQADDSLFTQLQRMMQAKQPLPDLVQLDSFYAPPMVENGIAIDMTPYIDRWKNEDAALLEKQAPGMFYKIDDKVVGLITTGTMDVVYYRADWLKEVGKTAPFASWDDVLDALRAIKGKHPDIIPWSMIGTRGEGVNYLITQMKSMGVEFKGATQQLDTDAGKYLINFYQTLVREGLTSKEVLGWGENEARGAWIGGKSAMMFDGIRSSNDIGDAISDGLHIKYPEDWNTVLPPLATTKGSAPVGENSTQGRSFQITSTSKHPYEASLVLRHMVETDQALEAAQSGAIYFQNDVLDDQAFQKAYPYVSKDEIEAFKNGSTQPASSRFFAIVEVLEQMVQDIINNPDASTDELAKKWQSELDAASVEK